jgi:putative oxidoreductase
LSWLERGEELARSRYEFTATGHIIESGTVLQRLFSTFANGWPGRGLLLLRVALFTYLIYDVAAIKAVARFQDVPRFLATGAGVLVLLGLWTPVSAAVVAILEIWVTVASVSDFWLSVLVATIAAGLVMLGPGAWSLDARLFGRKRISIGDR